MVHVEAVTLYEIAIYDPDSEDPASSHWRSSVRRAMKHAKQVAEDISDNGNVTVNRVHIRTDIKPKEMLRRCLEGRGYANGPFEHLWEFKGKIKTSPLETDDFGEEPQ